MTEVAKKCLRISYERTKEDKNIVKHYSAYKLRAELGLEYNRINSTIDELYDLGFTSRINEDGIFYISPDGSVYVQNHL